MTFNAYPDIQIVRYQKALREGLIHPEPCEGQPELYVLQDEPEPYVQRLTYSFIVEKVVKAYVVYTQAQDIKSLPCFRVCYATAQKYRGQGLATRLLKVSLEELSKSVRRQMSEPGLYIETVVTLQNVASQKVASRALNELPESIIDRESGEPLLYYGKYLC